jgi:hypothetical protein
MGEYTEVRTAVQSIERKETYDSLNHMSPSATRVACSSNTIVFITSMLSVIGYNSGSLMVRPLGQYVKREDMIDREFLTSLLLVIPKYIIISFYLSLPLPAITVISYIIHTNNRAKYDEFLTEYETLEDSWREREKKELRRRAEEAQTEIARKKAKDAEDNKRAAAAAAATAPTTTGHHEDHEVSAEEVKKNLEQERIREAELKVAFH